MENGKDKMISGFICEIDGFKFKIFELKRQLLVEVTVSEENEETTDDVEIGDWVSFEDGYLMDSPPLSEWLDVSVENGELIVKTTATIPCTASFPRDMRKKYRDKVWSPWIQYVRDESFIFEDSNHISAKIIAKYAPSATDDYLFELISVDDLDDDNYDPRLLKSPWSEEIALVMSSVLAIPRDVMKNHTSAVNKQSVFCGVCLATNAPNKAFNPNFPGSSQTCSILFCRELGLVRSLEPASHEVGGWYQFLTNDKRWKGDVGIHYFQLTARMQKSVMPRLKSEVVQKGSGHILQIETQFLFDKSRMELNENAHIKEWSERRKGLFTNSCFNDLILGKVEVYPNICESIIRTIETYQDGQSAEVREKMENEKIVITVKTELLKNWWNKFEEEHASFFHATEIVGIKYGITGESIHE